MTVTATAHAIDELPEVGEAAVGMGVFDGVHRGHLEFVAVMARAARERGVRSVALVFDPHPDEVVRPGSSVPRLATLAENLRRLVGAGVDVALPVRFDAALRALAPEDFLTAMQPAVTVRALVMTPDAAFGRNRSGTPDAMRAYGQMVGFDLVLADALVADEHGPISSARVRAAIASGDLPAAGRLLGHPAFLEATPDEQSGIGWRLVSDYTPARPPPGRYEVVIRDGATGGNGFAALVMDASGQAWLDGDAIRPGAPLHIDLLRSA